MPFHFKIVPLKPTAQTLLASLPHTPASPAAPLSNTKSPDQQLAPHQHFPPSASRAVPSQTSISSSDQRQRRGKIGAMVEVVRSALLGAALAMLCLWLGCNTLWDPFLETRSGTDGSSPDGAASGNLDGSPAGNPDGSASGNLDGSPAGNPDGSMPTLCIPPSGPGVCSCGNWCWQNPLPQGHYLIAIWGVDANNIWAVGEGGTIV